MEGPARTSRLLAPPPVLLSDAAAAAAKRRLGAAFLLIGASCGALKAYRYAVPGRFVAAAADIRRFGNIYLSFRTTQSRRSNPTGPKLPVYTVKAGSCYECCKQRCLSRNIHACSTEGEHNRNFGEVLFLVH